MTITLHSPDIDYVEHNLIVWHREQGLAAEERRSRASTRDCREANRQSATFHAASVAVLERLVDHLRAVRGCEPLGYKGYRLDTHPDNGNILVYDPRDEFDPPLYTAATRESAIRWIDAYIAGEHWSEEACSRNTRGKPFADCFDEKDVPWNAVRQGLGPR